MSNNQTIVLSGANIKSGGPLTIFNDALFQFSQIENCLILAIVNNSDQFYKSDNIKFITLPNYKKFIFLKFYYEYIYFWVLSKQYKPDVWISLNDFTPNVAAKSIFTYFHNASIFFNIESSDYKFSRRVIFQKFYYSIFLRFNLKKNKRFIVQQNWIGYKIHKKYNLPLTQILTFKPKPIIDKTIVHIDKNHNSVNKDKFVLFYPTRAYGYKNIEFICETLAVLCQEYPLKEFELRLTITKDENAYSKYLKKKYNNLPIRWLGSISKFEVEKNYEEASVMIFPSRLETWGLPLTEFSKYRKPIFAIDLEYVYETMADYPFIALFKPNDLKQLIKLLKKVIEKSPIEYTALQKEAGHSIKSIKKWEELLAISTRIQQP